MKNDFWSITHTYSHPYEKINMCYQVDSHSNIQRILDRLDEIDRKLENSKDLSLSRDMLAGMLSSASKK